VKVQFIVPSYNIEKNINDLVKSFKEQKNSNWECIIIDDMSTDSTWEKLQSLVDDTRIKVRKNTEKKYALKNIVEVAKLHQDEDDVIIAVVDGDDSLCNDKTVDILIESYEDGSEVVWTAHKWDTNGMNISGPVPDQVNPYFWPWRSSHLRTFKSSLLRKISTENFKNVKGKWFKRGYDQALMLPLIYVSRKHKYVPEVCYTYNIDSSSIPAKDRNWCETEQISTINFVRSRGFIE
jgi:glycosyltransferase involved in cell wall biosynthesis